MTQTEYADDARIDRLIHEQVLHRTLADPCMGEINECYDGWICQCGQVGSWGEIGHTEAVPAYSTEWGDVGRLLDTLKADGWFIDLSIAAVDSMIAGQWEVLTLWKERRPEGIYPHWGYASASIAPRALALAVLDTAGVQP